MGGGVIALSDGKLTDLVGPASMWPPLGLGGKLDFTIELVLRAALEPGATIIEYGTMYTRSGVAAGLF